MKTRFWYFLAGVACTLPCFVAHAQVRNAYFGELHLHTTMSFDAWSSGTKVTPDQAYKFGEGQAVMVDSVPARRSWPLDFMAVTDHSEMMGVFSRLNDPASVFSRTELGREFLADKRGMMAKLRKNHMVLPPEADGIEAVRSAWDVEQRAANDNYQPNKFTTFIGYEWTAMNGDNNLHRNVIFAGDHAPLPFTSLDSNKPEDLWSYLAATRAQGIDCLAIPHNGNASGGLMYNWNDSYGKPIDEAYAQKRMLNEPLTEIMQTKGQSETVPFLSPNDEFANFEIWDHLLTSPSEPSAPAGSYIRDAFGRGLVIEARVGANPYKFGVVGASDIHNGLSASDENATGGIAVGIDPHTMALRGDAAKRALGLMPSGVMSTLSSDPSVTEKAALEFNAAGITGVWAESNTRESIFAALKRKEAFATSGTRIRVRMFGGWNFDSHLTKTPDWVATAYATGVPMGGDLPAKAGLAKAPSFAFWAIKDPDGANLDRIQVIKLWLEGGNYKEKIFDVALSNRREVDPRTGRVSAVGTTVDLKTGKYTNTIGATELSAVWRDPEFDASKAAVYYARVLEIPTARWSTLVAIENGLPIPNETAPTIQERAWTSPIWFTPVKS